MDKRKSAVTAPEMTEEQIDDALGQVAMQRLAQDDGTRIPLRDVLTELAPDLLSEFEDLLVE